MHKKTTTSTIMVAPINSEKLGHITRPSSPYTSRKYFILVLIMIFFSHLQCNKIFLTAKLFIEILQARRDSNPQPADLESAALPIRATGLYFYFDSLCDWCVLHREQNFFNCNDPGERFFETTCV